MTHASTIAKLGPSDMDTFSNLKADLSTNAFLKRPLEKLEASLDECLDPDEGGMKREAAFANALPDVDAASLRQGKRRRSGVFELAADNKGGVATVCAAAMAWGGMNVRSWNLLWESSDEQWFNVAQCIRDGKPTRAQAYERLRALRADENLKGMGSAFFTKLIYFLTPRNDPERKPAYIMDRWAGSSVNLLTGSNTVLLEGTMSWRRSKNRLLVASYAFTVSDANSDEDYEAFCATVDRLAERFGLGVDEVDRALFSTGRPYPGTWRQFVGAQGQKLLDATGRIRSV